MSEFSLEKILSDDWGKETSPQRKITTSKCAVNITRKENNDDTMAVNNNKSGGDSEFALSKFLDEIIDLPIKKSTKSTKPSTTTKTVKQIPLSDVTNTTHHLQKTNSSLIDKEKPFAVPAPVPPKSIPTTPTTIPNSQAPLHTLTSTQQIARMDSLDDGIWLDIDHDLLTLIESGGTIPINHNTTTTKKSENNIPHVQKQQQKEDIDKKFNSRFQGNSNFMPSFSYAGQGNQFDISTQANRTGKSIIESANRDFEKESTPNLINGSNSFSSPSSEPSPSSSNSSPQKAAVRANASNSKVDNDVLAPMVPPANFMMVGFSNARGNSWKISAEKLKEQELKFKTYNDEFIPQPDELPNIPLPDQDREDRENVKRHKSSNSVTLVEDSSSGDIELSDFDDAPPLLEPSPPQPIKKSSFAKASGSLINAPSKNGLEQSNVLFKDVDEVDDGGNKKRLANGDLKYNTINQLGGFTLGFSGKAFEISTQKKRNALSKFNEAESLYMEKESTTVDESSKKILGNGELRYEPIKQMGGFTMGGFTMGGSGKQFDISSQKERDALSKFNEAELSHMEKEKSQSAAPNGLPSFSNASKLPSPSSKTHTTPFQSPTRTPSPAPVTSPFRSPPKTTTPFKNPSNSSNGIPKRPSVANNNRTSQLRNNKPFKSPVRSKEGTRAAAASKHLGSKKATSTRVFDLTVPKDRQSLSSLGKPLQCTKQQLVPKNIPIAIINMTATNAKYYRFNNTWGCKEAQQDMIKADTLYHRTTLQWVENHYGLIVWKKACLVRSWPERLSIEWNSKTILDQLLYRYEREVNMGHRSVLKKILEADDIPAKHMILVITDIVELKQGSHDQQYNVSSKYRLQLSDGWYQIPARIDTRMEKAIKMKKLKIGSKLSICGAQILGDKEGISPLSNDGNTMLSISANGCLPARWDQKLGYHPQKYLMRSIPTIFDDGGTVTALDIVVCRKFPILYSETLPSGAVIIRTAKEEEEARQRAMGYDGHSGGVVNFKPPQQHNHGNMLRQKIESNVAAVVEERKVSGYFKLLICDTKSSPDQRWAYLTLSNANELNHMDIVEGNRYKLFFVVPQQKKNQQGRLYLKTTFMTRWEPAPPMTQFKNAYIPRYLSTCNQIPRDRFMDFDLVVLVLQTSEATREAMHGRVLYHQTILVTDQSQGICQIDLHLPTISGLHNHSQQQQQQVLGFANLKFVLYDEKFGITHLKATDETEVISRVVSSPEYIQKGIKKLREWVQQNPDEVQAVANLVRDIVQ